MSWLKVLYRRKQFEQELEDEINSHLAMEAQQRIDRGESPEDARLNARRDFGNVALTKDITRDVWRRKWLDEFRQDVAYALRMCARNPGFTLIAFITLALGIGATTAIFTVTNAVLIRPLPYRQSDRLVAVWKGRPAEKNV